MRSTRAALAGLAVVAAAAVALADDAAPPSKTLAGEPAGVLALAFSPDAKLLAIGMDESHAVVVELESGTTHELAGHTGKVRGIAFSPDGQFVATACADQQVRLFQASGAFVRQFSGHEGVCDGVAISPDGQLLASTSRDGTVRVWELPTGREVKKIERHTNDPDQVAFSADGTLCAFGTLVQGACVWEVRSGAVKMLTASSEVNRLGFSPDGKTLATTGFKTRAVTLWDVASANKTCELAPDVESPVRSIAWAPDGKTLAVGSANGVVRSWDIAGQKVARSWTAATADVSALAYSADGGKLASGSSSSHDVTIWDMNAGR